MSEYNNQNKGAKKSSFAKPGDENIVSGKSFFLSFGKQKKGPSNPLIESEKNKNNNTKNSKEQNNGSKNDNKNQKSQNTHQENRPDKQRDKNHKGKHHGHYHGDKKQNQNIKPQEKSEAPIQQDRQEKNNSGFNHKNKHKKNNRHHNQSTDIRDEKRQDKHQNQNHHKNSQRDNVRNISDEQAVKQEKAVASASIEKKVDTNPSQHRFDERKRHKHKKEKFVPTAPETTDTNNELLQPIVDRASLVSSQGRSFGLRNSKSIFSQNTTSAATSSTDEPQYVDRNRPLAEQILEQSKPKVYKNNLTEETETVEVIGVRFREAGKVYYFDPKDFKVEKGQAVIVETARGVEYGFCAIGNRFVSTDNIVSPLKPILRVATNEDTERYESNKNLEAGAAKIFREKVRELGLEMSLVYVEYTFDNGKLLFYFTADGRVDFRELIKELAAAFRTRIELRQIGVRDEAKIVGGLGICGRPVCCKSFLGEFSQVSIKMAKDQNLFINSSKISGTCGRFMCCIRYEDEVYQKEYEKTPKVDAIVETPEGKGVVVESNALKGQVKVILDNKPDAVAVPFKCTEVKLLGYLKKDNENELPDDVEIAENDMQD